MMLTVAMTSSVAGSTVSRGSPWPLTHSLLMNRPVLMVTPSTVMVLMVLVRNDAQGMKEKASDVMSACGNNKRLAMVRGESEMPPRAAVSSRQARQCWWRKNGGITATVTESPLTIRVVGRELGSLRRCRSPRMGMQ